NSLPARPRRLLARPRAPDDDPHGLRAPRVVRAGDREAQRLHGGVPPPRDGNARKPRCPRHAALLRVLGSDARADVLHHRHLGRKAPHLRHDEVLPLHDGGLAPHVRRDPLHGARPPARHRPPILLARRLDAGGVLRRLESDAGHGGTSLRRVHARFPREGAALAAPHMASGCPRRGSDGRLDHPGGRPPEARDIRPPALRVPPLPARSGAVWAGPRRPGARGHRLRGVGRRGPEGHEEARRILVREPPRARRARHRRGHGRRSVGRDLHDGGPRSHDRPSLPPRGRPVRAPPHARDGRVRRHRGASPRDDRALPHRHARLHRAPRPERVRRRVPHPRRRLPGEGRMGGHRGDRHDSRRDLPPDARPEGVLGPRNGSREPRSHRHQRLGAGGRISSHRPHRSPRCVPAASPDTRGRQRADASARRDPRRRRPPRSSCAARSAPGGRSMTGFFHVTGADLTCVAPELVLAGFATLILLLDAFARPLRTFFPYVTLLALALANLAGRDTTGTFFGGAVESSGLSRFIELIALGAVALAVLGGAAMLERDRRGQGEFYALLLFSATGLILMARGVDLLIVFLGLELMSLSLYVLAAWYRDVPAATEAALKYFLTGALASAFLLYGIATV